MNQGDCVDYRQMLKDTEKELKHEESKESLERLIKLFDNCIAIFHPLATPDQLAQYHTTLKMSREVLKRHYS